MGIQRNYEISETFTVLKLAEDYRQQLIPACKTLDVLVVFILLNLPVENHSWQKSCQWCKYIFDLVHRFTLNNGVKQSIQTVMHGKGSQLIDNQ